ncbi:MAG: hypothetical protein ACI4KM_10330 [Oscillospiraceae bacterium]
MNTNDGYSISVYPIQLFEGKPIINYPSISDDEQQIIAAIYGKINERYVSNGQKELLEERFEKNLFFCCLESGAAMFSFIPGKSTVSMAGFFIEKRDLKTAWRLFLPYFIYLFIAGNCSLAEASVFYLDSIRNDALDSIVGISTQEKAYADEIIKKVRTYCAPISFSATQIPESMILGNFVNLAPASAAGSTGKMVSQIVFPPEAVAQANTGLISQNKETMEIRFCRSTVKRYKELRRNEIKSLCQKQYQKEMMKEIDDIDDSLEAAWYFNYSDKYYISLDNDIARMIEQQGGMISFEILHQQMAKAIETVSYRCMAYQAGKPKPQSTHVETYEEVMERIGSQGIPQPYDEHSNTTSGGMSTVSAHKPKNDIIEPPVQQPSDYIAPPEDENASAKDKPAHKGGFFGLFKKK